MLSWLWLRLAAAALIQPLAWELPYVTGAAIQRKKKICERKLKENPKPNPKRKVIQ